MQPEDEKSDLKQPQETAYFAANSASEDSDTAAAETQSDKVEAPAAPSTKLPNPEPVHWQSPEYHHNNKSMQWFIIFGLVSVSLVVAAVLLLQSWTFAVLVVVMAVALGLYAQRPPRMMDYTLSEKGLFINDTLHGYAEFKAFGVIHDGNDYSVTFIPVRRFSPEVTAYFPEASGEAIVDMLGVKLPMQPLKTNVFDRIIRYLGV
jgi:hypothetical protein